MPKFIVTAYLEGSVDVEVEAADKHAAVEMVSNMSLEEMGLQFVDDGVFGITDLGRDGNYSIQELDSGS